ncbi:MAG: hypothetical protein JWR85_3571 [Marmoricola sp.]|nr:hypothetical protein [Marmoricola sp.]
MSSSDNVVPSKTVVTEQDFLNAMVTGLARAQASLGSQKMLAAVMDLSAKQVGNIMAGGSTDPKRLWDVRAKVPTALDDIADLYGVRIVPRDSICSSDSKLSVATCALLKKAIDAELDGTEDHRELLDMERELREMRALIDVRLEKIGALRAPRVAA